LFLAPPDLSGQQCNASPKSKVVKVDGNARRRWHLAYTLLQNPQLIELRRRPTREHLQAKATVNNKNVDLKLTNETSLLCEESSTEHAQTQV